MHMKTQKKQGRKTTRKSMSHNEMNVHYIEGARREGTVYLGNGAYAHTSMNSEYGH